MNSSHRLTGLLKLSLPNSLINLISPLLLAIFLLFQLYLWLSLNWSLLLLPVPFLLLQLHVPLLLLQLPFLLLILRVILRLLLLCFLPVILRLLLLYILLWVLILLVDLRGSVLFTCQGRVGIVLWGRGLLKCCSDLTRRLY